MRAAVREMILFTTAVRLNDFSDFGQQRIDHSEVNRAVAN
jgi:hypothetical protein